MKILDWLFGNWISVLGGIAILALCIYVGSLHAKIGLRDAKIGKLEASVLKKDAEIEDWKKLYQIIGDKLAEQNKSILDLKKKTEAAKKARIAAEKKAEAISAQAHKQENVLQTVPASTSPDCEAEMSTIRQLLNTRG